jgi:uncharacterized glyoxalase superfamily protein PhnB
MLANRSMPRCTVIPELAYPDVGEAAAWLCDAFGFTLRLGIGNHRAQINAGDGALVVTQRHDDEEAAGGSSRPVELAHSVMVRVDNVDRHHEQATRHGARVLRPPTDYPYGERQYTVQDPGGHVWTFSQSIADINPTDWGGTPGQL